MVKRVLCGKNFVGLCFVATLAFSHCAWPQRALPVEELKAFSAAFDLIKKDYVGEVDDKKLFADAIRGMVSGLDAHSVYWTGTSSAMLKPACRGNTAASESKCRLKRAASKL